MRARLGYCIPTDTSIRIRFSLRSGDVNYSEIGTDPTVFNRSKRHRSDLRHCDLILDLAMTAVTYCKCGHEVARTDACAPLHATPYSLVRWDAA